MASTSKTTYLGRSRYGELQRLPYVYAHYLILACNLILYSKLILNCVEVDDESSIRQNYARTKVKISPAHVGMNFNVLYPTWHNESLCGQISGTLLSLRASTMCLL